MEDVLQVLDEAAARADDKLGLFASRDRFPKVTSFHSASHPKFRVAKWSTFCRFSHTHLIRTSG